MQSTFRFLVALTLTFVTVFPVSVSADDSTSVLISEILTGTSTGAGQEFVELYNPTPTAINLSGWKIEYKSATSTNMPSNWNKKADLSGQIDAQSYYLVAPKSNYPDSDSEWSSTLATSGGHIRLVDGTGKVIDLLGYGNANSPEGSAAIAPAPGQSIERLPGKTDPYSGNAQDTNDNAKDFLIRVDPEPQNSKSEIEPRIVVDQDPTPEDPVSDENASFNSSPALLITELFIDPESPLTDADDEFIEIFNPNDFEINYEGYVLKGGSNFKSSFTLPAGIVSPKGYVAFTSAQTGIPLTNSGGAVQLFDPEQKLIDQTLAYQNAKPGQSWSLDNGSWGWSLIPTKAAQNVITLPSALASSSTVKKTSKQASPKSAKVKAPAKAKKTATKSSKAKAAKDSKKGKSEPVKVAAAKIKPASWLLITLAIFTMCYAIYEFRHDISNSYKKLRWNLGSRKSDRKKSEGRGDD